MARILIAGCGYLGCELARRLAGEGHTVFGLRREVPDLDAGFEWIAGDLGQPDALAAALPGEIDFAVHAAAPRLAAGASAEDVTRGVYLDGLSNLLRALTRSGSQPRRVFFVSSTSVYGQKRGEWVDEASPTHPTRKTGEILLLAEKLLAAADVPGSSLRLGGLYGPGRTRLIENVRSGRASIPAGEPHYTNRIHRDDAARAIAHLIALDAPAPLYLGVDCEPAAEEAVFGWLAQRLEVAQPTRARRDESATPRRAGSKRCRNALLLESGFTFEYPSFREGYAALLDEV